MTMTNTSMYAQSSLSGFDSTSLFESQQMGNSSDSIPLQPTTETGSNPDDQPFARPRKVSRQHFWRKPCSLDSVILLGDLLLTLTPCLFLVLSFLARSVNNNPVSSARGQMVEQAAKLGPTIFPIIFAAVIARLLKTYALWRAERGACLGILEQLNGSQNLAGAFERAILLPGLGFVGIAVVLLWTLSPLGGQSALRVLDRKVLSSSNTTTIYYYNNSGDNEGAFHHPQVFMYYASALDAIFQASLISNERVQGRDIWGNLKIPVLQYVPSYTAGQSQDGWYDFDENDYDSPYSAFTGLLMRGLNNAMETTFTIESSYFNLTCTEPVFFDDPRMSWYRFEKWLGPDNSSLLFKGSSYDSEMNPLYEPISCMIEYEKSSAVEPRYNIIYASHSRRTGEITAYTCTVGISLVETDVLCDGDCHVKRLRPSQNVIWSENGWPWSEDHTASFRYLLSWLEIAICKDKPPYPVVPLIEYYMMGHDNPIFGPFSKPENESYRGVDGLNLAKRLQSVINTAWQIGYQGSATAHKPSDNATALIASQEISSNGFGNQTSATLANTVEKHDAFAANTIWIVITILISFILLVCGIVTMFLKYDTHSPDILGYVSSMTRDNSNFEQIPHGDRLDGLKRAKMLRHMQVQIVDVRPWDADGLVTLKPLRHQPKS